jgi:predicted nucleic acid-binding protein
LSGYLVDTSIFIAAENRRTLGAAPEGKARISVATLTELHLGVINAKDSALRRLRSATLAEAKTFIPLAYDEAVAESLARLIGKMRAARRRASAEDAIIAATAMVHGLTVWTQDSDFEVLAEVDQRLAVHLT